MCVDPQEWDKAERRAFTPVELKHIGLGPKISLVSLLVLLSLNILGTGIAYQKLVSGMESNRMSVVRVEARVDALPPPELVRSVEALTTNLSNLAISVATQTTTIQFVAEDVRELEREVRALRNRE